MPLPGDYPRDLQKIVFQAYRRTGHGDESLGEALSAADRSGASVGSSDAVSAWRRGVHAAPIGALQVMLEHSEDPRPILSVLCRRYGFEVVALKAPKTVGELERAILLVGGGVGDIQREWAHARHPDSEAGPELSPAEREHLARMLDDEVAQLAAIREQILPSRAVSP